MIQKPISVYLNWASYDELSDNVELTESLAMRQLEELLRLRKLGVRFDYYVMDAFWFSKDGGYREWRKPHWLNGPDRWLQTCIDHDVKPGLWLGANNPAWMHVIPAWQDSFDPQTGCMCCFYGGFMTHYIETLHLWYERGVRLFKFDFSDFSAAPPSIKESLLPSEIRTANVTAFRGALKAFRRTHADVVLLAYNGFEERTIQNTTDEPPAKVVDQRWLEIFDSIYCGDPRPADIPTMNFWRSKDIYSDHMVRMYELNNIPLQRIDNSGFMIGLTGTCYYRGTAAWKGMLALSLARGGWVNSYYGNLELLSDEDGCWFAELQQMYFELQASPNTETFGGLPGESQPYGFVSTSSKGTVIAVVNPSPTMQTVALPLPETPTLIFTDSGFKPIFQEGTIQLGPEQLALVGIGAYAVLDFGQEQDVHIPVQITPIEAAFTSVRESVITTTCSLLPGRYRVIMRQHDVRGRAVRTTGGSPPAGKMLGELLRISIEQSGQTLPIEIRYDKAIWSGLSWAVGEFNVETGSPVSIYCETREQREVTLVADLYRVAY